MQDNLLIVAGAAILGILIVIILGPCKFLPCPPPPKPPVVKNADNKQVIMASEPSASQQVTSRPLVESPNAGLASELRDIPNELAAITGEAVPRPLVTFSNSSLGIRLSEPQTSPTTIARPLAEHSNSGMSMAFAQPPTAYIALPRPFVEHSASSATFALRDIADTNLALSNIPLVPLTEHVDAGWTHELTPPAKLFEGIEKNSVQKEQ